jgi:4-amino-4-deoxy-L-arabinose transferase-like glycosyltransferase
VNPATRLPDTTSLWRLYAIAAATFLPAIGFYYVGEEAIFPISSLEMGYHGEWLEQLFYGGSLKHNPLYNWLIIPLAGLAGWEHVLGVARVITIAATIGAGFVVAWLARALYREPAFAAFTALVYLTLADAFFYRGWLAYADPLFAFFSFGAIATLWVACERRSAGLLALAVAALSAAFMTKALTAYAFYGAAGLVLLARREHRTFLLGPASWIVHVAGAAFPLAWFYLVPDNTGQGGRMFAEIVAKLAPTDLAGYAVKLVIYPLDTAARLAPALFIAAYYLWRRRDGQGFADAPIRTALWIALLGYLPYWLAPQSAIRYLMPLYPLAGLVIARVLWNQGGQTVAVTRRWFIAAIALKLVLVLVLFPQYQERYRGRNFETAALDIRSRAGDHPLYTLGDNASGLSVTAYLDIMRLPAPPLTVPPAQWESGFVIALKPDPALGRVSMEYPLGGNKLYLLCRGNACAK